MPKLLLICVSLFLAFSVAARPAQAYTWMMREGINKCATCHTDPGGGELLTHFGRVESETVLSTRWGDATPGVPTNQAKLLYGIDEPSWLNLGGSLRTMGLMNLASGADSSPTLVPMQYDLYGQARVGDFVFGGSIGLTSVTAGSAHGWKAAVTSNVSDEAGARSYNMVSRYFYVGYHINEEVLVRAGRLNLPFGLRMPEHVMWVRDATLTDRESDQQYGASLAYTGGPWRAEIMAVMGNYSVNPDSYRERGYSGTAEYFVQPNLGLGLSSYLGYSADDLSNPGAGTTLRTVNGIHSRWTPTKPLVILAELDLMTKTNWSAGYTAFLQADIEALQGLHFRLTGEMLDRGKNNSAVDTSTYSGSPGFGGWASVQWFPITHLDVQFDARVRQDQGTILMGQVHFYL